ncbi:MAG: ATP-grasp domain-containing protein [Patescibacteria group bacterium]
MPLKRSILIIGSDRLWEEEQLLIEAGNAGYEADFITAASVTITVGQREADLLLRGKSIRERFRRSRVLFRRSRGAEDTMSTLALLARHWKVPATDSPVSILTNINKALSMPPLTLHELRHIATSFLQTESAVSASFSALSLPLLIKPARGRHGEGVRILRSREELEQALNNIQEDMLLQEYLPIDEEFRAFVVGNRSLGVIRKIPPEGSVVANYAAGARFVPAELPASIEREAVTVCHQQEIDIGGVDIARVGDRYHLLEVNRCPEFRAFMAATKVNVAQKIIEFLPEKDACFS